MKLTETHFQHAQDRTEWHKYGTELHEVYKSKHAVTQTTPQVLQHKSIRQIYFTTPPLMQQLMKIQVLWDVTLCEQVQTFRRTAYNFKMEAGSSPETLQTIYGLTLC